VVSQPAAALRLPDALRVASAGGLRAEAADAQGAAPPTTESEQGTLPAGCYALHLTRETPGVETPPVRYDGTLRVERDDRRVVASGDLYLHAAVEGPASEPEETHLVAGIPVFPCSRYRSYVRVTGVIENFPRAAALTLAFEVHDFARGPNSWSDAAAFSAELEWTTAPSGPSRGDVLRGEVRDASGTPSGDLTMAWVSHRLRRAVVEIDCAADCEAPLANAADVAWPAIFDQIGWDLTIIKSDDDLPEPTGESWSDAELHAAMCSRRDQADLDVEWRYLLLCVRRLDNGDRGLMFDRDGTDTNNVPREAAGIAAHWEIPDEDAWGPVRGMRFGSATDPYFRTAVHEIGHTMGLLHSTSGAGLMRPTDAMLGTATAPRRFPQNIEWSFSERDLRRLRHLPDIWIRPGGVPFAAAAATALPEDAIVELDLRLEVAPLLTAVPIGAPVRVDIMLHNHGAEAVSVPTDLSLKDGHVRGSVTDPSGTVRSFRSLVRRTERRLDDLAGGQARAGSMTVLRGAEGALFPMPGPHSIHVRIEWEIAGVPVRVAGEAPVMVLPALDETHAESALRILSTPDALITLAIGGDHMEDGIAAIDAALASDVLRPHVAYIEARRRASAFQERSPDVGAAADLIDADTVMSDAEVAKAARLLEAAAERGEPAPARLVATLRERAENASADRRAELLGRLGRIGGR
jgi:hypothetical protein